MSRMISARCDGARVLTHCATDRKAAEPLLILLRRFATESAWARMFCDELMAEEATAPTT